MRPRNRLELFQAGELPFKRLFAWERVSVDDFDRAPGAHHVSRQPHFSIAALADTLQQVVVGNLNGGGSRPGTRPPRPPCLVGSRLGSPGLFHGYIILRRSGSGISPPHSINSDISPTPKSPQYHYHSGSRKPSRVPFGLQRPRCPRVPSLRG